ncbi:M15 family metallopeptidase [Sphingomonas sp. Leaf357]|uniref:M15 family metallopeptidase n=1 Tax=Sphingomonas sp. Leaf357 TaxID=1736350 RepID=UPI001F1A51EF|nr:M15 family metallopeptidase [Sphingomonas sp. Leaf357]
MVRHRKRAIRVATWCVALVPAIAVAAPEQLCAGQLVQPGPDGRVLGHLPYIQVGASDLVPAPKGFALGQPCLIHRDAAPDLARLLHAAAGVPGVAGQLRAISCYRTIVHQRGVFCSQIGPGKRCADAAERARAVGPPGFSEHATGYAIDFGIRPSRGCADVDSCIAATVPGRWLLANAPGFGFELSFPSGNAQNVTWEPWHWRWVGNAITARGASRARAVFAVARYSFPASPAITDMTDRRRVAQVDRVPALPPKPPAKLAAR